MRDFDEDIDRRCDKCGGILVKKEYQDIYVCEDCGQEWYFKDDFG